MTCSIHNKECTFGKENECNEDSSCRDDLSFQQSFGTNMSGLKSRNETTKTLSSEGTTTDQNTKEDKSQSLYETSESEQTKSANENTVGNFNDEEKNGKKGQLLTSVKLGDYNSYGNGISRLHIMKQRNLSEAPTMIIGFPDETVIPTKVCGEIVDALKLPFIGTISADCFNSGKTLVKNGIPFYPIRLYGEKELVLAMTELEFKKSSQPLLRTVFNLLMHAAGLLNVNHIVSIAGQNETTAKQSELFSSSLKDFCEKKVQFLTTDKAVAKRLEDKGYEPIADMTLKGINNLLLSDLPFPLIGAPELTIVANVNNKSDGWSIVCLLLMICAVVHKKELEFEKFSSREKSSLARLVLKTRDVNSALKESAARMWL